MNPMTWLNYVVLAFTGESATKRPIDASHEIRFVRNEIRQRGPNGSSLIGDWLTDTVSYYH